MIVRLTRAPEVPTSTELLIKFDFFNDYKDTCAHLRRMQEIGSPEEKKKARQCLANLELAHQRTAQVGPKGRHITLPEGAGPVVGRMRRGDLVADIYRATWGPIDEDDIGLDASIYELVCRPGSCPHWW